MRTLVKHRVWITSIPGSLGRNITYLVEETRKIHEAANNRIE